MARLLPRVADPGLFALKGAVRVAIVVPVAFAIADGAIGNEQMAIFAAFGGFAMLVFVDFGGPWRARLGAYAALAAAGIPLIALGTLCSHDAAAAAAAMAVVGFAILFSGVVNGYLAAGANSALLAFVCAVMIPAPSSAILDRAAGWAVASALSVAAVMLLWPGRPRDRLRESVSRACRALADVVDARSSAGSARAAILAARRQFVATPYRPSGPTGPTAALANLVDDLGWARPFATAARDPSCFPEERAAIATAVLHVLRASAARLEGERERPDVDRLVPARAAVERAFVERVSEAASAPDDRRLEDMLDEAFRLRGLAFASELIGVHALAASGERQGDRARDETRLLGSTERLAAGYATVGSVWLRNSVRATAGLTLAVLVGHLADVQNAFWVVLGALSVLRSNALGTGATVLQALAGTAIGIVAGGALVFAIGTNEAVLWVLLPFAVLLAGYAPRVISFAAGQAGFTIAVMILFNLIQPTGWGLGIVRVEDVALGCAISLGAGVLFWPRGAASVLRGNVATAYARSADYMAATLTGLLEGKNPHELDESERVAVAASRRLDDAVRQYLAERSPERLDFDSLTVLVSGVTRVWRVAHLLRAGHVVARLGRASDASSRTVEGRRALNAEIVRLHTWYLALGDAVEAARSPPAPPSHDEQAAARVRDAVRGAIASGGEAAVGEGLAVAWVSQHIDVLHRVAPRVAEAAAALGDGASIESAAAGRRSPPAR